MPATPPEDVLDLFAVPGAVEPLPGGLGRSVRSGDLVLSPGRDPRVQSWLSPLLARLAVRLDESPGRRRRDLRVAMPVPARDGSWVVDGWGASRYEPGTTACRDLDVTLAAGRVLHAQLDAVVRERPDGLDERGDRWAEAERVVFGRREAILAAAGSAVPVLGGLVERVVPHLDDAVLGPDQLVHADLAGNVLLDAGGAPVVIDVAPAWRPVRWAEAVCVLDSVARFDAPREALGRWTTGPDRQAMLRAVAWRALSDRGAETGAAYASVLSELSVAASR